MWISRQVKASLQQPIAEPVRVTANNNGNIEAVGSGVQRDIGIYAPYGYCYSLPTGERLLVSGSEGTRSGLGVAMSNEVKKGEVKISNAYGAYIYLRNDGTVEISGKQISANGEVIAYDF